MERSDYNGWRNRETWLVALHCNPEKQSDVDLLEDTLEDDFMEMIGESNFRLIYSDLINFNLIDWQEIRDSLDPDDGGSSND